MEGMMGYISFFGKHQIVHLFIVSHCIKLNTEITSPNLILSITKGRFDKKIFTFDFFQRRRKQIVSRNNLSLGT